MTWRVSNEENVYRALARDVEPVFRGMLVFSVVNRGYQTIFGRASIRLGAFHRVRPSSSATQVQKLLLRA